MCSCFIHLITYFYNINFFNNFYLCITLNINDLTNTLNCAKMCLCKYFETKEVINNKFTCIFSYVKIFVQGFQSSACDEVWWLYH